MIKATGLSCAKIEVKEGRNYATGRNPGLRREDRSKRAGETMINEADTCRLYVIPGLTTAGWNEDQIREQVTFTDGRIVVAGTRAIRRPQKRADYLLRYRKDFTIAVVEAKAEYRHPADGLQQAKQYAEILGLKFAYATNGHGIVEHDYLRGQTNQIDVFPGPEELWQRLANAQGVGVEASQRLLTPTNTRRPLRYYQEIAINRAVQTILMGINRVLWKWNLFHPLQKTTLCL